jgi:hypothetical protein
MQDLSGHPQHLFYEQKLIFQAERKCWFAYPAESAERQKLRRSE